MFPTFCLVMWWYLIFFSIFSTNSCWPSCGEHGSCNYTSFQCECHLGWISTNCSVDCGCHGHSTCEKVGVGTCDKCHGKQYIYFSTAKGFDYLWTVKFECSLMLMFLISFIKKIPSLAPFETRLPVYLDSLNIKMWSPFFDFISWFFLLFGVIFGNSNL